MARTTRKALTAALDELGLTERAMTGFVTVQVAADGTLHSEWSDCLARGHRRDRVQRSVRDVLTASTLCTKCEDSLMHGAVGTYEIKVLLGIHSRIGTATRAVRTGKMSAASVKLLRQLRDDHKTLTRAKPDYELEFAAVAQRAAEAIAALTELAGGDQAKQAALKQCREALLPRNLRAHVALLDDEQVLIGITPAMRGTDMTRRVLTALTYAPEQTHQVLVGPRYVVDYLNREMFRSGEASVIVAAPVADATPEQVHAAITLWDPTAGGPMASLAMTLDVARDLHAA